MQSKFSILLGASASLGFSLVLSAAPAMAATVSPVSERTAATPIEVTTTTSSAGSPLQLPAAAFYAAEPPPPLPILIPEPTIETPKPSSPLMQYLPSFNKVESRGPFDIRIIGNPHPKEHPTITWFSKRFLGTARVINHTLYLRQPATLFPLHYRIPVEVHLSDLQQLTVAGDATVVGSQLRSPQGLNIEQHGLGRVQLEGAGPLQVNRITNAGSGSVNVQWINTPSLVVYGSRTASISISGVTKNLEVHLTDAAQLDAQYLRTTNAWVQSEEAAKAKVIALDTLRAFARDESTIYYFNWPKHLTRSTYGSGNVLQMDWRA